MSTTGLLKLHRVQANELYTNDSYFLQSLNKPVKRVSVSNMGEIGFNPDSKHYVYFSKTDEHHIYYIFNKVIKIIIDQLEQSNQEVISSKLKLPDDKILPYYFYSSSHTQVIKQVKDFFLNYLPENCVELVTLNYLNSFSDFFNRCSISNKIKRNSTLPETSDIKTFGGAYGINSSWLDLLKCCTVSTSQSKLYLDDFFTFMIDNSYKGATCRTTLKQLLIKNPEFFEILNLTTYVELQNPTFKSKNNINNIRKALTEVENQGLYKPEAGLSVCDFKKQVKIFKNDIELYR